MKRLLVVFAVLTLVFACKKGNDNPSEGKLTGITLSEHSIQVTVGGFHVLAVKFTPENASEGAITWVSSNPSVATVSDGIVSGIAPGKTEIFAKVGNLLDKCQVTVKGGSGGETSDDPAGKRPKSPAMFPRMPARTLLRAAMTPRAALTGIRWGTRES